MAAAFRILYFPPATSHTHLPLPNHRLLLSVGSRPRKSNLHLFLNAPLRALPAIQSQITAESEDEVSTTRLLVQNVPWTSTEDDLRPLFQKYGTVVEIEFSMYNKERNRGLAFVTMGSPDEALAAFNSLEASEFEGRVLKLNWAKPKKPKQPPSPPRPKAVHNLFVTFLPFQARSKDLKEFFNAHNANAVSAEIIFRDNPRRSAGYGFVSFNTKAEADAALAAFQGKEFMGRTLRVAPSKRFLRQETAATIQSASESESGSSEETSSSTEV
ncbi:28 kDa ribonucleoprotein, chloroplastic [Salvia miltiorrhiza]|uniref:28 kDa ribonucleoprotein, chloroplastic n=1 Tax=Salvia miltiorrhiza TaxID=226208 RepID=UPI0025ABBDFA|nr:28 kDa ribonucleoprotein, chloroplastic [Salvia miltiorrhiza]